MFAEKSTIRERVITSIAGVAALGTFAVLGTGCSSEYSAKGTVEVGADGKEYIIPDGSERPIYASQKDCEADVASQIKKIEEDSGDKVKETPAQLCQPVSAYAGHTVVVGRFYGPIVEKDTVWTSSKVVEWQKEIPSGTFDAPGLHAQSAIEPAPKGSVVGHETTVDEHGAGFGETGETGYHGGFFGGEEGGMGGEHGGGFEGGFHGGFGGK